VVNEGQVMHSCVHNKLFHETVHKMSSNVFLWFAPSSVGIGFSLLSLFPNGRGDCEIMSSFFINFETALGP
jgi:hypothetical protein